jgi:exonuclease V gamma subunit
MATKTFFSNKPQALMAALIESVDFKKCIDKKVTILVPNQEIGDLFYDFLVEHKKINISMFLKVVGLEEGIYCFKKRGQGATVNFQTFRLLILSILKKGAYFKEACTSSSDQLALSKRLASLFMRYRQASGADLQEWLREGGQVQEIFTETLKTFALLQKSDFVFDLDHELHFFGFESLPALYHEIIFSTKRASFNFYFLSATPSYWGDLLSSRGQWHLRKKLRKKGVNDNELDLFESICSDTNPILAQCSRLSKALYTRLVDESEGFDLYVRPKCICDFDLLQTSIYEQSCKRLQGVGDGSFEVIAAFSRLREVEILFDKLLEAFSTDKLAQKDVAIFAPDISEYLPAIEQVFCCQESPFNVEVRGLRNKINNVWMQTFSCFLEFLASPFNLFLIERFIFSPSFSFIHLTNEHRDLLEEYFLQKGHYKKVRQEILESLALDDTIALEKSGPLGDLISVIDKLEALHGALGQKLMSIDEWSSTFVELIESLFASDENQEAILSVMFELCESSQTDLLDFNAIVDIFHDLLHKKVGVYKSSSRLGLVFNNLGLEAIVPKKRIYCLGLDEESFVRHDKIDVLADKRLLEKTALATTSDSDRATILKMILSAQDNLTFSFTNVSPTDGKKIAESLVLKEILSFMGLEVLQAALFSFDASYFTKSSYKSETCFRLAQSYYKKCDLKLEEGQKRVVASTDPIKIDLDDINALLAHPLRFYAKKNLGLYLESYEKEPLESREFMVSYAQTKGLVEKGLMHGVDAAFQEVGLELQMSSEPWLDAAKLSIQRKVHEIEHAFKKMGIRKEDLFSHEFRVNVDTKSATTLFGQIDLLSSHGLIIHEKNKMQGIFKNWGKIVLLNCLKKQGLEVASRLCFTATGKSMDLELKDPFKALESLVAYFKRSKSAISPLTADNIQAYMKGKEISGVQKTLFHDPYLELLKEEPSSITKEIEELCKYINV